MSMANLTGVGTSSIVDMLTGQWQAQPDVGVYKDAAPAFPAEQCTPIFRSNQQDV